MGTSERLLRGEDRAARRAQASPAASDSSLARDRLGMLMTLQRTAGNTAVAGLIENLSASTVQRDPSPAPAPGVSPPSPPPPPPAAMAPGLLPDLQLGAQLATAQKAGDSGRASEIEDEFGRRADRDEAKPGVGVGLPPGLSTATGAAGQGAVTPEVALKILENMSQGEPGFKPELGKKGAASWFVTEGNPFTATDASKSVTLDVTIDKAGQRVVTTPELDALFEAELLKKGEIEAAWRAKFAYEGPSPPTGKMLKSLKQFSKRFAEAKMWDKVGELANTTPSKVVEVVLEGSQFSKSANGRFTVVADASRIKIKGGISRLIEVLDRSGIKAEPAASEAALALATKLKWAGKVRTVLRYGGRILIVVAVAADVVKIYRAQDHLKATVESLGGWAGATAGAAAFAAWWAPADVVGPWAWVAHGVGTLAAGGLGYWIGESTTRWVYEVVVE